MHLYRILGLGLISLLFAFKSVAIPAMDNLTDKEKFYLTALFFSVDDQKNLQAVVGDYWPKDWVKPLLFSLATSGNNDLAPELCRYYFTKQFRDFRDRSNVLTDLEVIGAGETANLMIDQHLKNRSSMIEIIMMMSRLTHLDVLVAEAKKLAQSDTLDLKNRLAIMLSKKRGYGGYCESSNSWLIAPRDLREGPKGLLRFFLAQLKILATNNNMMDEYNGFIKWMEVLDIDATVDIQKDPWEVLDQDINNEARELGAYDIAKSPRLPARSEEQLEVLGLIGEIQRFDAFVGVVETWTMKVDGIVTHLEFCRKAYFDYLRAQLSDQLYPRLHKYRGGYSKGDNTWVLDSVIFAMSVRPEIALSIDRINEVKYVYAKNKEDLKKYVNDELIHRDPNIPSWTFKDPLERKVKLRWLKNISAKLGLENQYAAMIVYYGLEAFAPAGDDNQDVYEWTQNYIDTHNSQPRARL